MNNQAGNSQEGNFNGQQTSQESQGMQTAQQPIMPPQPAGNVGH